MDASLIQTELHKRLAAVRRKENVASALQGSIFSGLVLLLTFLVTLIAEDLLYLSVAARTASFWLLMALGVTLLLWRVAPPLGRLLGLIPREDDHATALKVGGAFPGIRDRLVNALELAEERETTTLSSPELIDASLEDLNHEIEGVDFTSMLSYAGSWRMGKLLAMAGAAGVLLFAVFPGSFFGASYRLLHYQEAFTAPAPFRFLVEPGDREVIKGVNVPLRVRVEGTALTEITLAARPDGQLADEERQLRAGPDGTFRSEFTALKSSMRYAVYARGVQSPLYRLTVIDRPLARSLHLLLTPPPYTRLPEQALDENVGDVTALRGTKVTVAIEANKNLRDAALIFGDSTRAALAVQGRRATGTTVLMKERSYHLALHDSAGTPSADPVDYGMRIIPDAYPIVSIVAPGTNLDVADNTTVNLAVKVGDDYGFSRLRLAYKLVQSRYEKAAETFTHVALPVPPGRDALVPYAWNLKALHLVPEDVVTYCVEVFDNDAVSGPKSAISEFFSVRLPSFDEVFAEADRRHDASIGQMSDALKAAQEARKELEELQQDLTKNREKLDWQDRAKAEEMLKKYEEVRAKMDEVKQAVDKMADDLQRNNVLSKETLQKYQELQQMMEQMASPEFAEAMKRLQQSMQVLSPEAMKQALQQFKFSEENFRKSIERTMNLLKRIQIEQKVDEAVRRADAMIKQQEELQKKTAQATASDRKELNDLARQQQEIAEQRQALDRELTGLRTKMEEFPAEMPLAEMEQASKEMTQSGLEQQMKDIVDQLQAMQPAPASQMQQQSVGSMGKVAQQLHRMQQELRENQQRQIVNEMRRTMRDLLDLSKREEALKDEAAGLEQNSQRFRENAESQMEVMRDLGAITERLAGLGQKTFGVSPEMGKSIGEAMRSMSEAMRALEQRNGGGAAQQQQEAMGSLNEAAQQVQSAINAMAQGGGQGMGMAGLMQRLQQMSAQQQGINDGTRNAGGMTPEQAASMGRLAAEQGAVRKSLEQLTKEAAASGELSKMLGDLNRVAQEMREVQTDLAGGNVNPETMKKQDRILSRLLDAQRSTRERDFEKERKSTAGRTTPRPGPGNVDLSTQEGHNRLRRDLQKALEEGYARDYEELIKRYFDVLEQQETRTR